jgi:APA family basic amino acid/polyamine antiporter
MGEFVAWIIGWDLVLEYALGAATVAVSWSQYVDKFLANYGIHIPQSILHGPWDTKPGIINLPSILIICLLSLLLMRGTKESASLNNILVILKVTVVIVFIGLALLTMQIISFIPVNEGEALLSLERCLFLTSSVATILVIMVEWYFMRCRVVFFAFIGFDAVSTAAQEAKIQKRNANFFRFISNLYYFICPVCLRFNWFRKLS